MRLLYYLVSSFVLWILPLIIVFYSLAWNVSNPEVYLGAFRNQDFYNQMSELSRENADWSDFQAEEGVTGFLLATIMKDFTPEQWQDLVEGNVVAFTEWLSGESDLVLYIPTDDLEKNLSENLNQNVQDLVNENSVNIPECSVEQTEEILRQGGFDPEDEFCLPAEVKSGQESLSDFLGTSSNQVLENLLQNNYLSLQRNRYSLENINTPEQVQSFLNGPLNFVRDGLLVARSWTPVVLVASLAMLVAYVVLAWLSKKEVWRELGKFFRSVGISLLITSAVLILFLGGTYFLNATLLSLISPIFSLGEISSLMLWTVLNIAFNLVAPAIWLAVLALVLWLIFSFLASRQRKNFQAKNSQILNHQPDYTRAQTFDSQFRQAVDPQAVPPQPSRDSVELQTEQNYPNQNPNQDQNYPSPEVSNLPPETIPTNPSQQNLSQSSGFTDEYFSNSQNSTSTPLNESVIPASQNQPSEFNLEQATVSAQSQQSAEGKLPAQNQDQQTSQRKIQL